MKQSPMSNSQFLLFLWGLGIIGQLCWNMENQWFNTFVYAKIAKDPTIISWMVALSALATTLATFLFGTWSDRCGKRKPFIVCGYILWGIFTILFGTTEFITKSSPTDTQRTLLIASGAVIVADALMSFFGSMGSDAGYNAWVNDKMTAQNCGQIGAALATQPIIGTIVGTVVGGFLIGSNDNYMRLFVVMGGLVIVLGILTLLFVEDSPEIKRNRRGSFWQQIFSAFNFRELKKQRELIAVFLLLATYFTAFDVYFPHLGNYMIYYLGFDASSIGLIEGIALILGMLSVIPASKLIERDKLPLCTVISILLSFVGIEILGIFIQPETVDVSTILNWPLLIGLFFFGCGYVMFMQVTSVWMKQLFPEDAKGQFEGFRVVFFVLVPWLISPFISNPIIKRNGEILDSNGLTAYLPTNELFLISGILILLSFIPLLFAMKLHKQSSVSSVKTPMQRGN